MILKLINRLYNISTRYAGAQGDWGSTLISSGVNDEARSYVLEGCVAGTVIRVCNEKNGSLNDDWALIYVKQTIPGSYTVRSFEVYIDDAYIPMTVNDKGTLDGKVSYISLPHF